MLKVIARHLVAESHANRVSGFLRGEEPPTDLHFDQSVVGPGTAISNPPAENRRGLARLGSLIG